MAQILIKRYGSFFLSFLFSNNDFGHKRRSPYLLITRINEKEKIDEEDDDKKVRTKAATKSYNKFSEQIKTALH